MTFADYGVHPEICAALAGAGITHPFPIQAMTLPVALGGADIIGQAKTGTGKTLGFGVPMIQRVVGPGEPGFDDLAAPGKPQALVVAPTRELALQVADDLTTAAKRRAVRVAVIFGGRAYDPQIQTLNAGVEIIVGTPGRLLDLGFLPDVERLLAMTPAGRQTMLFSATMPAAVVALARLYMTQPVHIRANDPGDDGATVRNTTQFAYRTHPMDRIECLARLLQADGRGLTIVFTRTRRSASKIADDLTARGFAAAPIHGDLGQGAREQALRAFRNGKVDVLIATDVAARGIDVEEVTHVVNYECPDDARTYIHRIGRTGRAGASGTAVTFVEWADTVRWNVIAREIGIDFTEPVETYSTSEHFFTDLHIPAGTGGRLPRASRTRAGLEAEVLEDIEGKPRTERPPRSGGRSPEGGRSSEGGRSPEGRRTEGRSGGRSTEGRAGSEPRRASEPHGDSSAPGGPRAPRRRRRSEPSTVELLPATATVASNGGAEGADASGGDAPPRRRRRRRPGSADGSPTATPTASESA